jgi:hypothetical protein
MLEKSRGIKRGLETVLITCALAMAFCLAAPRAARAQTANLQMLAVNHLDFGEGNEVTATTTNTIEDPVNFYSNTVTGTSALDVMLVTLAATGDTHCNNRSLFKCTVDGTTCLTGNVGSDSAPAGWITLMRNEADEHDNSISYTWCVPIKKTKKNEHAVKLFLANSADHLACDVFIEQVNVVVEAFHAGVSKLEKNACTTTGTGVDSTP